MLDVIMKDSLTGRLTFKKFKKKVIRRIKSGGFSLINRKSQLKLSYNQGLRTVQLLKTSFTGVHYLLNFKKIRIKKFNRLARSPALRGEFRARAFLLA